MKSFLRWLGIWMGLLIVMAIAERISSVSGDTADQIAMILFFLAVFAFLWPVMKWFIKMLFNPAFWVAVVLFWKSDKK